MAHVAVILSGCGVYDGAEIHESVLTLLALEQNGASYQCLAPNIDQHHVIDHTNGEEMPQSRNVLVEAARIARGAIQDISEASAEDYDAVILPGGFGAAKNLCDFAFKGSECQVQPTVQRFLKAAKQAGKPLGFICIAPAMIPRLFDEAVTLTIGNDKETADNIEKMGGRHQECAVDDIVVDGAHQVVTTPAYMLAQSVSEAHAGIDKLVSRVLAMAG